VAPDRVIALLIESNKVSYASLVIDCNYTCLDFNLSIDFCVFCAHWQKKLIKSEKAGILVDISYKVNSFF
jgi:hypothetical protein